MPAPPRNPSASGAPAKRPRGDSQQLASGTPFIRTRSWHKCFPCSVLGTGWGLTGAGCWRSFCHHGVALNPGGPENRRALQPPPNRNKAKVPPSTWEARRAGAAVQGPPDHRGAAAHWRTKATTSQAGAETSRTGLSKHTLSTGVLAMDCKLSVRPLAGRVAESTEKLAPKASGPSTAFPAGSPRLTLRTVTNTAGPTTSRTLGSIRRWKRPGKRHLPFPEGLPIGVQGLYRHTCHVLMGPSHTGPSSHFSFP